MLREYYGKVKDILQETTAISRREQKEFLSGAENYIADLRKKRYTILIAGKTNDYWLSRTRTTLCDSRDVRYWINSEVQAEPHCFENLVTHRAKSSWVATSVRPLLVNQYKMSLCNNLQSQTKMLGHEASSPLPPLTMLIIR